MADKNIVETVTKALEEAKKRNRSFSETVEVAFNIKGVDLSVPKNRIKEEIVLPHGRGKEVKIGVFASGELAVKSKKVADRVIGPEELNDLADDSRVAKKLANEFDFFLAAAPLMPTIGKTLGVALGPRGKMPKPLPPNADPGPIINSLRKTVRVRSKARPTFHTPIGTVEMDVEKIAENLDTILRRVIAKLAMGKQNISSVYVKTTMGPAIKLEVG